MIALDSPTQNRDAVLDLIYQIQTDLKILTETLARAHYHDMPTGAVLNLASLQEHLHQSMPSLNLH